VPLVAHYGLALAPRLLGPETAQALAESTLWTLVPFALLALGLGLVARARGAASSSPERH
jgi:hypothetical protein